jgi:hypothetical protein
MTDNLIIAFSLLGFIGCSLFALWLQPSNEPSRPAIRWSYRSDNDNIAMWAFIFGLLAILVWWLA